MNNDVSRKYPMMGKLVVEEDQSLQNNPVNSSNDVGGDGDASPLTIPTEEQRLRN